MPSRMIVSTGAWKGLACGTSMKSANQPFVRTPDGPPGFDTMTSYRAPAVRVGEVVPILVEFVTAALTGMPPIVTVAPGSN